MASARTYFGILNTKQIYSTVISSYLSLVFRILIFQCGQPWTFLVKSPQFCLFFSIDSKQNWIKLRLCQHYLSTSTDVTQIIYDWNLKIPYFSNKLYGHLVIDNDAEIDKAGIVQSPGFSFSSNSE